MYTIQTVQKIIDPTRPGHIACTACTDLAISRNREAKYMLPYLSQEVTYPPNFKAWVLYLKKKVFLCLIKNNTCSDCI